MSTNKILFQKDKSILQDSFKVFYKNLSNNFIFNEPLYSEEHWGVESGLFLLLRLQSLLPTYLD